MTEFRRGLVAMSADPIHWGHLDLITSAARRCEKLFVLVSNNDQKKGSYVFGLQGRIEMARRMVEAKGIPNVEVIHPPTQVLADTYLRYNCDVIFRGIRNAVDYEYEKTQMSYHTLIYPRFHVEFIEAQGENRIISSSMIKAFTSHHIDVSKYVPNFVKRALEERINNQYKIAVTGEMSVGKSWVTDQLVYRIQQQQLLRAAANQQSIAVSSIKIDELLRSIYEDDIPGAIEMRREMQTCCSYHGGGKLLLPSGAIDRKALGEYMFSKKCNDSVRQQIQRLTMPLINMRYREALCQAGSGIIILEWAQLAEMEMGNWTNHNTIVVDSPDRKEFVKRRNISEKTLRERGVYQWSADQKVASLQSQAAKDGGEGHIIRFSNTIENNQIEQLISEIQSMFGGFCGRQS